MRRVIFGFCLLAAATAAQAQSPTIPYVGASPWSDSNPAPVNVVSGGGTGGTASNFDAAFPGQGTAIGLSDATNMKAWLTALALGDGVNGNNTAAVAPWVFNGASFDRNFTCSSSAAVSVTAGSTTEIVALSSAKVIRVCSLALSMSAAGTAQVVAGTGTNCGTATADLTGAMTLATGVPVALSAANGSLLRTPASNALCVVAATGDVTGFISYAQY